MRLDADDYLHENAIAILSGILDRNKSLGLVFPDYFEVDNKGDILSLIRRHDFKEVTLKDQPAHGACTLIRKSILEKIGGYDEEFTCQDGWDLWLKVTNFSKVFNSNLPLFFYRRHNQNLTSNERMLLDTRSKILLKSFNKNLNKNKKALGIINIRGNDLFETDKLIERKKSKSLLDSCIETCLNAKLINEVVISTTSEKILKSVQNKFKKNISFLLRKKEKSYTHSYYDETIFHIMGHFPAICEKNFAGMIFNIEYPFINESDINSSISALDVFNRDMIIGVRKDNRSIYKHNGKNFNLLNDNFNFKEEKNDIYREGGIKSFRFDALKYFGSLSKIEKIGHVILNPNSFYNAKDVYLFNSFLHKDK